MSYRPAVDRRARRRRNLVLLFILAVVVGVIALAVSYRTERRETADFLAVAQELADDELDIATSLADLLASIGDLERPDILLRLESLAGEAAVALETLDRALVPRPASRAGGLFAVAVDSWSAGVGGLAPAFIAILDRSDDDETGDQMLAAAFRSLQLADAAYDQFLVAVDEIDRDVPRGEFPVVSFASGDAAPLFDADTIASRLRLTRKFDERHDVAVTANTEPEPITDPTGVKVLPLAESYTIVGVVTNEGNVGEEAIMVSLRLTSTEPGAEPIELTELVPFLDPGEATAVPFPAVVLQPGTFYRLRLAVSIAEDDDVEDNVFELPFFTNEAK